MTEDRWQQIVEALGMTDQMGAAFGLTPEETAAHRQAFRDAAIVGGDAFLAAVEREKRTLASEDLSVAERLRLQARQAVALVIEEYFTVEALASFDGTRH
jgi:hypothetical protein